MPNKSYQLYTPGWVSSSQALNTKQPKIPDVRKALNQVNLTGNFMAAHDGRLFPSRRYTSGTNHFQGIQRLRNSNYLVISGSDKGCKAGHLFVVGMGSRTTDSAWRTNVFRNNVAPAEDKVIFTLGVTDARHGLSGEFWHVGGLSSLGDLVAAPVESPHDGSVVLFYSFTDPERPKLFRKKAWIKRPHAKAGVVAMCKLPGGRFLVLVLGKHLDDKLFLDSYRSKSADIGDGFERTGSFDAAASGFPDCQGMDILVESGGQLYIATTRNTGKAAPVGNGDDLLQLFKLGIDNTTKAVSNLTEVKKLIFQSKIKGTGKTKYSPFQANFNAGASLYVHPSGALFVYSCFHWRRLGTIPFEEFHPNPELFTSATISSLDQAWVDFYEYHDFGGLRFSLLGERDARIENYGQLAVQSKGFFKAASSLRYQISAGKTLRLYQHKNFKSKNSDHLDLVSRGKLVVIRNLKKKSFGDKLISSEYV